MCIRDRGKAEYPQDIKNVLVEASTEESCVVEIDALATALAAGSSRAVNMVMLGALSFISEIPLTVWEESVMEVFALKEKLVPLNLQAFHFGRDLMR